MISAPFFMKPASKTRRLRWLGLQASVLLVMVGCSQAASAPQTTPLAALTPAERTQLAQLEARPLKLPPMPADGHCVDGPYSQVSPFHADATTQLYGRGPVYAFGGPRTNTSKNIYFDVTFYTDPTVKGVVLIRAQQLDGLLKVLYVGPWAAGPIVGTDTIDGKRVELYGELAVSADRPPSDAAAAPGWGIWHVRQGIDKGFINCTGFLFDTASGSEVFVAAP